MTAKRVSRKGPAKARAVQAAKSGPTALERVERRGKVLRLRNGGASLSQIAEALNISTATVRRDIELGIADYLREPAEQYIGASLSRIYDIRRSMWPAMLKGDTKAVAELIKLEQREATLLGLDAPSRVTHTVATEDYAATLAELMLDMGLQPPGALAASLQRPAIAAPPPGPVAANDGVPQEIIDVDAEDTEAEPWV